ASFPTRRSSDLSAIRRKRDSGRPQPAGLDPRSGVPSFGHRVMLSETKSYPVPHVGQTTWSWKVSGGDRVDDTGKSGLRSAVGSTRRRGAGSRNKSATHAPTM